MATLKTYIFGRDAVVNLEDQKKFYGELQRQYEAEFPNYQTLSELASNSLLTSPRATNFPYPFVTELEPLPCQNSKHYDPPIPYDIEDLRKRVQKEIVQERLTEKLTRQANCAHSFVTIKERGTQICARCQLTRQAV